MFSQEFSGLRILVGLSGHDGDHDDHDHDHGDDDGDDRDVNRGGFGSSLQPGLVSVWGDSTCSLLSPSIMLLLRMISSFLMIKFIPPLMAESRPSGNLQWKNAQHGIDQRQCL